MRNMHITYMCKLLIICLQIFASRFMSFSSPHLSFTHMSHGRPGVTCHLAMALSPPSSPISLQGNCRVTGQSITIHCKLISESCLIAQSHTHKMKSAIHSFITIAMDCTHPQVCHREQSVTSSLLLQILYSKGKPSSNLYVLPLVKTVFNFRVCKTTLF